MATDPIDLDRLDALSRCLVDDPPDFWCPGCRKVATSCQCAQRIADAYPALAAELRAARTRLATLEPLVAAIVKAATTAPAGHDDDGRLWQGAALDDAVEALVRAERGAP